MAATAAAASPAESGIKATAKPATTATRRTKTPVAAASDAAPSTSATSIVSTANTYGSRRGKNAAASGAILQHYFAVVTGFARWLSFPGVFFFPPAVAEFSMMCTLHEMEYVCVCPCRVWKQHDTRQLLQH
jgi:hypothetical protein